MSVFLLGAIGFISALLWLVLLVVTQFNAITISMGLLGAVYVMGRSGANQLS